MSLVTKIRLVRSSIFNSCICFWIVELKPIQQKENWFIRTLVLENDASYTVIDQMIDHRTKTSVLEKVKADSPG